MATLRQVIVDTDSSYSGYDYTSLASAISNEQGDISLTSGSDEYVVIECYATSGTADSNTDGQTVSGFTTETANYVEINGLLDASYGHEGIWDSGEYRLTTTGAFNCLTIEQEYCYLIGIQLNMTNTSSNIIVRCRNVNNIYVEKCIVKHDTAGSSVRGIHMAGTTGSDHMYASNNIIYDIGNASSEGGMYGAHNGTGNCYYYNNTIHNCYEGISTQSSITAAINNIVNDCTTDYSGTFESTSGYNVTDTTGSVGAFGTTIQTGTTTSATTNKLNDSGGGLSDARVGSIVQDGSSNYSYVTAVDSDTVLSVADDIFGNSEAYTIYTNIYGAVTFQNEGSDEFLLGSSDTIAKEKGKDLSTDTYYPIDDDILGTSRPQ